MSQECRNHVITTNKIQLINEFGNVIIAYRYSDGRLEYFDDDVPIEYSYIDDTSETDEEFLSRMAKLGFLPITKSGFFPS